MKVKVFRNAKINNTPQRKSLVPALLRFPL